MYVSTIHENYLYEKSGAVCKFNADHIPTASAVSELFLSLICLHNTVNILSIQKQPPTSKYMGRKGCLGQECKYFTPSITIPRGSNSTTISNIVITAARREHIVYYCKVRKSKLHCHSLNQFFGDS